MDGDEGREKDVAGNTTRTPLDIEQDTSSEGHTRQGRITDIYLGLESQADEIGFFRGVVRKILDIDDKPLLDVIVWG